IPRRDVKPLAKELIETFGSFADVIAASRERLLEVDGVGEAVVAQLKIVEAAAHRLAKTRVTGKPALSSWTALVDYCAAVMARNGGEQYQLQQLVIGHGAGAAVEKTRAQPLAVFEVMRHLGRRTHELPRDVRDMAACPSPWANA
ncbi:MAG: hypothetical protein KGQ94_00630, partial [Alphaproteobacteria bacterium]|nr:hypothetical protein [Alphaproteobacteria bacterium]